MTNVSIIDNWTIESLLDLTDTVRLAIRERRNFGSNAARLAAFLEAVHLDEARNLSLLTFETIKQARLDKLLLGIIELARIPAVFRTRDLGIIASATSLQQIWRTRLKLIYFEIDKIRAHDMVTTGHLKNVVIAPSDAAGAAPVCTWKPIEGNEIYGVEASLSVQSGHWWLNMACVHRDGLVTSEDEMPTQGQYGITTLPLLTGLEQQLDGCRVRYIREGTLADMHNTLLKQTGKEVRVLRGYRLTSVFAPPAGIRYDGMWRLTSYRQKLNDEINIYRLELTLERVETYPTMDELTQIPRPSQLDDWQLFEKLEVEKMHQASGEHEIFEWHLCQEKNKRGRAQ